MRISDRSREEQARGGSRGANSPASAAYRTVLGDDGTASAANSVALGAGSVADEEDTVSLGSAGNTRRITHVTAGVAPTDGVNVSQLRGVYTSLSNDIDTTQEGVAMAFAMSGTSGLAKHETFALSGGVGTFEGHQGAALGAAMRLDENWSLNAGVAAGMQEGTVGGRVGFRYAW